MRFWDRSIDHLVITHLDADHIMGLVEALGRYEVDAWRDNWLPDDGAVSVECERAQQEKGMAQHAVVVGSPWDSGQESCWRSFTPRNPMTHTTSDESNNSVVLRLSWDHTRFLLTGDIEADAEALLLQSGQPLPVDVLKVAHHGSGGSSTAGLLRDVDPAFAVISVGAENLADHPPPAVLDRLTQESRGTVVRTDERGTVEFIADGQRLWVRRER